MPDEDSTAPAEELEGRLLALVQIRDFPLGDLDTFSATSWVAPCENLWEEDTDEHQAVKIIQGLRNMADALEAQLTIDTELEKFFDA